MDIKTGLDGKSYMVFTDNVKAWELSQLLDIGLHCFDGYENALLLDDYVAASLKALPLIQPTAEALALSYELVDRCGRECDTPGTWSFQERDEAREIGLTALTALNKSTLNLLGKS